MRHFLHNPSKPIDDRNAGSGSLGSTSGAEITRDTRVGEVVVLHERCDAHALGAVVPECSDLVRRQCLGPAEVHPWSRFAVTPGRRTYT